MKCIEPNGHEVEVPVGSTIRGQIATLAPKYGFIRSYPASYFFLPSAVVREGDVCFRVLRRGQMVEFVAQVGERGPYATDVRVVL